MTACTNCQKRDAITFTTFECYCEECALDVALALLAHCRLSNNAINALVANGWNIPVTTMPHYTATDIAKELGCSAQKIGRTANKSGVKVNTYGEWRLDQAANSRKQIETFWYNDAGKHRLMELLQGNDQS
ncbi:hypothetical protein [Photobacterium carnosum]|uniref:hypothetical protein n=1 Tax=Photobacterium carnosum TaxID=2023717 RepID=UPI001E502840|nr:hypothetical protein [Photobacterium carnosum]MCD9514003.1 hypothetical protein [Photobacterium carnosum]